MMFSKVYHMLHNKDNDRAALWAAHYSLIHRCRFRAHVLGEKELAGIPKLTRMETMAAFEDMCKQLKQIVIYHPGCIQTAYIVEKCIGAQYIRFGMKWRNPDIKYVESDYRDDLTEMRKKVEVMVNDLRDLLERENRLAFNKADKAAKEGREPTWTSLHDE